MAGLHASCASFHCLDSAEHCVSIPILHNVSDRPSGSVCHRCNGVSKSKSCVVDHIKEFLLFRKKIFLLVQNFTIASNKVNFTIIAKNFLERFYQQLLCQVGRAREN